MYVTIFILHPGIRVVLCHDGGDCVGSLASWKQVLWSCVGTCARACARMLLISSFLQKGSIITRYIHHDHDFVLFESDIQRQKSSENLKHHALLLTIKLSDNII